MILVIGGRSKIGAALVGELLDRGERVRVLVRASEPAASGPPAGLPAAAEAVTGDLADEGSLVRATAATAATSRASTMLIRASPASA